MSLTIHGRLQHFRQRRARRFCVPRHHAASPSDLSETDPNGLATAPRQAGPEARDHLYVMALIK